MVSKKRKVSAVKHGSTNLCTCYGVHLQVGYMYFYMAPFGYESMIRGVETDIPFEVCFANKIFGHLSFSALKISKN